MSPTTRAPIETRNDPATAGAVAGQEGPEEDDRMDEGLHLGRAWHRYRYCYRRSERPRILDAGCGTGRAAVWAARLNPCASVLGVDVSAEAVAVARGRSRGPGVAGAVDFRTHDLIEALPETWGRFDFIVCRGVLAEASDPVRLLDNLARALDPAGLLLVTIPSHSGRQVARAFRQAVGTLVPPGAGLDEQTGVGLELFHALRPDHAIRTHVARTEHGGTSPEDVERVLAGYLAGRHDWNLDEAAGVLARSGLSFLYAATPWRWRPDRVFGPEALPDRLRHRVGRLAPEHLSRLIDALDPTLLDDEYQLYACPGGYAPAAPSWPDTRLDDPGTFDRLVPEFTGLAEPSRLLPSGSNGRTIYRTVSGTLGELDRWSSLLLGGIDGTSSCGEIEGRFSSRTRASDDIEARQERWICLADTGLIMLRPSPATGKENS